MWYIQSADLFSWILASALTLPVFASSLLAYDATHTCTCTRTVPQQWTNDIIRWLCSQINQKVKRTTLTCWTSWSSYLLLASWSWYCALCWCCWVSADSVFLFSSCSTRNLSVSNWRIAASCFCSRHKHACTLTNIKDKKLSLVAINVATRLYTRMYSVHVHVHVR